MEKGVEKHRRRFLKRLFRDFLCVLKTRQFRDPQIIERVLPCPGMGGDEHEPEPEAMFSYVSAEQRVAKELPLRAICALVDGILHVMSREFGRVYARVGRPSIPPSALPTTAR